MARKRTKRFEWVREDVEGAEEALDGPERPSPAEHAEHMADLRELANRVAELPAARRRTLPLDPAVLAEIDALAALGHTPARRRQVHRVKGLLSHVDRDALEAAIAGDGPHERRLRAAERWRQRLLAGGDEALSAFLAEHPAGDRQALRTALRAAAGTGDAATKGARRVFELLRAALEAAPAEE